MYCGFSAAQLENKTLELIEIFT